MQLPPFTTAITRTAEQFCDLKVSRLRLFRIDFFSLCFQKIFTGSVLPFHSIDFSDILRDLKSLLEAFLHSQKQNIFQTKNGKILQNEKNTYLSPLQFWTDWTETELNRNQKPQKRKRKKSKQKLRGREDVISLSNHNQKIKNIFDLDDFFAHFSCEGKIRDLYNYSFEKIKQIPSSLAESRQFKSLETSNFSISLWI